MSSSQIVLRRFNLPKPPNCPECKQIHGNRQTKNYKSTTGFFVHYTTNHPIDENLKKFLRQQIQEFQESDYSQFHEFLRRGRIE
jgi:hypothetical protein